MMEKGVHAMCDEHKKYALFIGRWQPFHNGHKHLIDMALASKENVCVAIRDTGVSEKDPYTAQQRAEMIRRVYGDNVKTIVIPDIASINVGRNVGYSVNIVDVPEHIAKISGTNVRAGLSENVPPEVGEYIRTLRTTIWLTGLPCAGKTTLGRRLKEELDRRGYANVHLDADDVRSRLNEDLGYSHDDRKENIRRVAHVARLFNENGILVTASFISPTNDVREIVREIIANVKLVFVKCSLETCEERDVKGMYARAKRGEIKEFTGVSAPFEDPEADIVVDTEGCGVEDCVSRILDGMHL